MHHALQDITALDGFCGERSVHNAFCLDLMGSIWFNYQPLFKPLSRNCLLSWKHQRLQLACYSRLLVRHEIEGLLMTYFLKNVEWHIPALPTVCQASKWLRSKRRKLARFSDWSQTSLAAMCMFMHGVWTTLFMHLQWMLCLGNTSWNWLFNKSRLHLWMVLFLLCDVDPIMINRWSYFLSWPLRDFFDVALDKNHNILETQLGVLAGDLNSTGTAELNRSKHGAYRINQNQIQF